MKTHCEHKIYYFKISTPSGLDRSRMSTPKVSTPTKTLCQFFQLLCTNLLKELVVGEHTGSFTVIDNPQQCLGGVNDVVGIGRTHWNCAMKEED